MPSVNFLHTNFCPEQCGNYYDACYPLMAKNYTDEDLQQALQAVKGGISKKRAADEYRVPRQTLQDRWKGKFPMRVAKEKSQRLSRGREKEVWDWAIALTGQGEPPTYVQIMDHVSCILEKDGDFTPLGQNWISGFVRRYPLVKVLKYRRTKRRQKVITPKLGREASDDSRVATQMDEKAINDRGDITVTPGKPEAHQMESTPKCEGETAVDAQLKAPLETDDRSTGYIISSTFWEPTKPSSPGLESFKAALRTRVKGLPRQIPGVRLLTRPELLSRGKSPPITIVHTETNSDVKVPSTWDIGSMSASSCGGAALVDNMLVEEQDPPSRLANDPGHVELEWGKCENMRVYLIEQALDSNDSPQWVFWKSCDTDGRIRLDWKPNSEIETQRLGKLVGRSWFYCPSAPVLNLKSAFSMYNQIKFRDVETHENNDILPVIFVTAYAGPYPEKTWTRYISSYNGQAHVQFHVRYVTLNPPSTITQPIRLEHGDGFGFRRDSYTLRGISGSSPSLLEGRISIALRTTTNIPKSLYSAVTLAESSTFQEVAPGKAWDENFRPLNCGPFTGIAVFQSMLHRALQFCKEENTRTIESIPPRSSWIDQNSKENTEKLINALCDILDQTTRGIKRLAKDCQAATQGIIELAEDHPAVKYNLIIEERWSSLIRSQKKVHEELASMLLNIYVED